MGLVLPRLPERPYRGLPSGNPSEIPAATVCDVVPWSVSAFLLDKLSVGPRSFSEGSVTPMPTLKPPQCLQSNPRAFPEIVRAIGRGAIVPAPAGRADTEGSRHGGNGANAG